MADPLNEILQETFVPGDYLSRSQIEIIKAKLEPNGTPANQLEVLSLIDSFVSSNEKKTPEYTALVESIQKSNTLLSAAYQYPEMVKSTLPVIVALSFYNLLVLVGVISDADIIELQNKMADAMNGKITPIAKA
ncbi:MAG: hypothetical protein HUJ60_03155 [Bacilli bacterium]|nr:hypothetical protein [Bacilli bacterium]